MSFRLTRTGWLFLALSVTFYFAALTSHSGLLLLLVGLAIGCLEINVALAWFSVRHLEIHAPPGARVCEGERLTQPWRVVNRGKRQVGLVRVESAGKALFGIGSLGANGAANIAPELAFQRRGVFAYSELRLLSVYPFGLARWARRCQLPGEVLVGPAVYQALPPPAAGYDVMLGGKFKGQRHTASGAQFAGVRPFRDGDSMKQIHWKSSAKGMGLMVKTFDEEMSGRVSFVLDNGGDAAALDNSARAAGSLMFAALDVGHHVEAVDLVRMQTLMVPPFADAQEILDWLARLPLGRVGNGSATGAFEDAVELLSRRGAIAFVLTHFEPAMQTLIDQLVDSRRRVAIYLPTNEARPAGLRGVRLFSYTANEILEGP